MWNVSRCQKFPESSHNKDTRGYFLSTCLDSVGVSLSGSRTTVLYTWTRRCQLLHHCTLCDCSAKAAQVECQWNSEGHHTDSFFINCLSWMRSTRSPLWLTITMEHCASGMLPHWGQVMNYWLCNYVSNDHIEQFPPEHYPIFNFLIMIGFKTRI